MHKESGTDQQNGRESELGRDEAISDQQPLSPSGTAAGLFQHRIDISAGGVPGGREPEEQARNKCD